MKNFRDGKHVKREVILNDFNTLMVLNEGKMWFATQQWEKLELLQEAQPDDTVLFSWQGKVKSSDIFELTSEDIERILSE